MSHNRAELVGQAFGRLTVIENSGLRYAGGNVLWYCRCECAAVVRVSTGNLRSGNTKSCGCLHVDISSSCGKGGIGNSKRPKPLKRCVAVDSEALALARHEAGMTQVQLGAIVGIGHNTVGAYEAGAIRHCHPDVLGKLAAALSVPSERLIATPILPARRYYHDCRIEERTK